MFPTKSWELLSYGHLFCARFFSRKAAQMEKEYDNSREHLERLEHIERSLEHRAYVIGSIFSAAAFLDAIVNELFLEADRRTKGEYARQKDLVQQFLPPDAVIQDPLEPLPSDIIDSMASVWSVNKIKSDDYPGLYETLKYPKKEKHNRPRNWAVLNKFQLALYLAGKHARTTNFDTDDPLRKDVELLVNLRHYLVHYSPEWIGFRPDDQSYETQQDKSTQLVNELRKRNFRNAFYPGKSGTIVGSNIVLGSVSNLLGANCAAWAAEASSKFVCEFARRMPVKLYSLMYCE